MTRSLRFGLVLSLVEKSALYSLARRERISAAAVVRRLIWQEAMRYGLLANGQSEQVRLDRSAEAGPGNQWSAEQPRKRS